MEPQNGQIVLLLQELKSAKEEIDSQGDRMKYLENALKRERRARENAERRARALAGDRSLSDPQVNGEDDEEAFKPPLDSLELIEQDLPNGHLDTFENNDSSLLNTSPSMETLKTNDSTLQFTKFVEASASNVEDRYELLKQEFEQMQVLMESYKRRADEAEESRRKFAEQVEKLRSSRNGAASASSNGGTLADDGFTDDATASRDTTENQNGSSHSLWSPQKQKNLPNGTVPPVTKFQQELQKTVSNALQHQHASPDGGGKFVQSAPYVSMVGVVLIGVGLMTWLNGWQPGGGGKVVE